MEKIYTKTGYTYLNPAGKEVVVSKVMIEKAVIDQTKVLDNIKKNLYNLSIDLVEMSKF